jgi:CubicO group peptidase (beta-lactamase class C family)
MHQNKNQNGQQDNMAYGNFKNCLKVSAVAISLLLFQVVTGQDFTAADQFLQKNQKALGNELVVIVQKDGKAIYKKELGKDFTIKSTASAEELTQWFTAAVVLMLQDEGKLSLDDPAAKYIPKFEQYMKGYITIRHALSHTTGLDAGKEGVGKILNKSNFDNLTDEVDTYITKRDIIANPGEVFAYNRIGTAIAARAAEAATKKTFDRLSLEKLFRTTGMRQTLFNTDNGKVDPMAGALTTGTDYMLFLQMLLNKGTINNKKILSESAITELRKAQFPDARIVSKPDMYKDADYCLTTWVEEKDEAGNAMVIRQGLSGTQAVLDFKNNTAILVLLKDPEGEKKRNIVNELLNLLKAQ